MVVVAVTVTLQHPVIDPQHQHHYISLNFPFRKVTLIRSIAIKTHSVDAFVSASVAAKTFSMKPKHFDSNLKLSGALMQF